MNRKQIVILIANLDCGHTVEVPDCCDAGTVTSCPDCEPPEGDPGVNRKIISIFKLPND